MLNVGDKLVALIASTVEGLGYELVDVERAGRGLLRVTLDAPAAAGGIGLDDCERVSHQLTHLFAVENVVYDRLEVSSPGLDRRLSKPSEFERFAGEEIQVQLFAPLEGRRRLRGRLLGISGAAGEENIQLELVEDDAGSKRQPAKSPSKAKRAKAASGKASGETQAARRVQIRLADVDRARLVPVVDFGKSAAKRNSGSAGR